MTRIFVRATVLVVALLVCSDCANAVVTPDWDPIGSGEEGIVIGEESISIPIYSGVGELPAEPSVTAPEPSSGLLAAITAGLLSCWRRRAPSTS